MIPPEVIEAQCQLFRELAEQAQPGSWIVMFPGDNGDAYNKYLALEPLLDYLLSDCTVDQAKAYVAGFQATQQMFDDMGLTAGSATAVEEYFAKLRSIPEIAAAREAIMKAFMDKPGPSATIVWDANNA